MAKEHAYIVQKEQFDFKGNKSFYYEVIVNKKVKHTANTQEDAADWAIQEGYAAHVARVRHLQDVDSPNHWREYP